MTAADAKRAKFVAGLRALAAFIETHPDLPVPEPYQKTGISPHLTGTDEQDRAEVDRIAAILGTTTTGRSGHHTTAREFGGGVTYQAVAIPEQTMREHDAVMSYGGAVQPATGVSR